MSWSPLDGEMKPNPLESLKNFTVPSAISIVLIYFEDQIYDPFLDKQGKKRINLEKLKRK